MVKAILLASVGVSAIFVSTAALAQSSSVGSDAGGAEAAPNTATDDIIVTARRVSERLQDVPVAVSAFTGEQLIERGAVNLGDVGALTSGFTIRPNGSNTTSVFLSLRGQATNEVLATVEPSVGTYVDELYWSRAYGLNASLLDVSNVQVLKGPQGTLFGRNTTGGALLVTSNDPKLGEFGGSAEVTYGRFNEAGTNLVMNVPVGEQVAVRGAFHFTRRDGWAYGVRQYNVATGLPDNSFLPAGQGVIRADGSKYRSLDELQGRTKLLWAVSDTTNLVLSGEWFRSESEPSRQLLYKVNLNDTSAAGDNVATNTAALAYLAYFRDHPLATGADGFDCNYSPTAVNCGDTVRPFDRINDKTTSQTYVAKLTTETSIGQFKLIGGYRQITARTLFDVDGSAALIHATTLEQDLKSWSGEAQLTGDAMDRRLSYAVGLTYFGEDGFDRSYSMSTRPGGVRRNNATRNYGTINNGSYGAYTQVSYKITPELSFTGGLRYSHDRKGIEIRSANVGLDGNPLALLPGATGASAPLANPCNATGSTAQPDPAQPNLRFDAITGAIASNDCRAYRSDSFSALSWTAGLDYKFTPDVLAYGKISRGYRAGGQNLRAFNDYQFIPFKPEILTEVELGLKSELFDRMVRFNISAYRNLLEDAQRNTNAVTNGISNTLITNAAKVRNIGFEADLTVRPVTGLSLTASGSYNDFKYLNYSDSTGDLTNTRPLFVPKYTLTLSGTYRTEILEDTSLTLNADYNLTSKMYSDPCTVSGNARCWKGGADATGRSAAQISQDIFDATTLPRVGILNARVTLGLKKDIYTISLWGRNLTNNNSALGATALVAPYRNYVSGIRRPPVMYGVTAGMKF